MQIQVNHGMGRAWEFSHLVCFWSLDWCPMWYKPTKRGCCRMLSSAVSLGGASCDQEHLLWCSSIQVSTGWWMQTWWITDAHNAWCEFNHLAVLIYSRPEDGVFLWCNSYFQIFYFFGEYSFFCLKAGSGGHPHQICWK